MTFVASLAGSRKKRDPVHRLVLAKLPFEVHSIQTDNGAEFQSRFHGHVADQGIEHVYIRPRTPRLDGKVERSHRIDEAEFWRLLEGEVIDDAKVFNDEPSEWEDDDNVDRPRGALNGQTSHEILREKASVPA